MFGRKPKGPTLDLVEAPEDVFPLCPHCKQELRTIWVRKRGAGLIEQRQFLICPHCRCFLGYGNINFS